MHHRHFLSAMTVARWRSSSYGELFKNLLFRKHCVHKQCSQCLCSCVETLVMLWAKFHVVLSLLSLKIAIFMLALKCPCTPLKISLPKTHCFTLYIFDRPWLHSAPLKMFCNNILLHIWCKLGLIQVILRRLQFRLVLPSITCNAIKTDSTTFFKWFQSIVAF